MLPGKFSGYELIAGGIWKRDILVADLEELENMDASELHPRRVNAKEVFTPQRRFPNSRWYSKNCQDEIKNSGNPPCGSINLYGAKTSATETNSTLISEPPGIRKPLRGAESNVEQDGAEALNDFWSIQSDFICRHHIEPRVQLHVPKEETFPKPLKY